jgi:hypothetical protein
VSVIGYIIRCDMCNAKMLVTADYKAAKFCPPCLDQFIADTIDEVAGDAADDDDHIPPWQVHG